MLKKTLLIILFMTLIAGGLFISNQGNQAMAVSNRWACVWVDDGEIDCHKPTSAVQALSGLAQGVSGFIIQAAGGPVLGATGISGWAAEGVQNWQDSVASGYNTPFGVGCGVGAYVCNTFFYNPSVSASNNYATYCHPNGKDTTVGGDEGCIGFVNLNPLTGFHNDDGAKLTTPPDDPGDSPESPNYWAIGRLSNAQTAAGNDECGLSNPTNCKYGGTDGEYTGPALAQSEIDKFKTNIEDILALEALEEACENEAPLSFITCEIFDGINNAIASLIGGQNATGSREGILIDLLTISPLTGQNNTGNVLQGFVGQVVNVANFIYIIVFLLLIFSSSLPLGLDNYTIKKMLPKFIAAVILTQFSFVICQFVIDVFNLLGTVVPNVIFALRFGSTVPAAGTSGGSLIGSGLNTAIVAGLATGAFAVVTSGVWVLIIVLAFIALIALLVAFVYMVLRYLVIYILVIISPLAFVAWVLPGTEKFFFNWWKNFIKVNAVFPVVTGMLAIAIVLSQVLVAQQNKPGAVTIVAMLIPIVALFMVPKTLKWTTQGMNALAAGALGFAAGKMGAGAQAVGKGAKATGKYAKSAGKDAANDYRTKKAGEMFGRGNKAGGALLMGKLPTSKGTHQAREAAAKAEREVAERNQASLASEGNNLQGLAGVDLRDRDAIENRLLQRGVRADRAAAQAALIHSRAASAGVTTGAELYNKELSQVALGRGSQILGVSAGDTGMQTAAITELGKLGDYQAIYDVQQEVVKDATGNPVLDASGNTQPVVSQSTIMKGIEPHIGDVMTKAPDLVKGGNGAFDNIGAEKIAALDKDSAKRMVAHVSNGANFRDPTTGAIDPTKHAAAVKNLHDEATRMAGDPRIVAGMDPRARAELNRFLQATGHAGI